MIALAAWFNESVAWLNAIMAAVACVFLARAAGGTTPRMRPAYAAAAVLAAVYSVSYIWLGLNPDRAADWSEIMRPVSLVAWWVGWAGPARASVKLWREQQR